MTASAHAQRRSRPLPKDETRIVHEGRGEGRGALGRAAETDVLHASTRPDARIAGIASAQRGLVTRGQLVAAGVGRGAIDHRLTSGRLHRMHRGVYLVGHSVAPEFARELGAVLACGEGAVLSHRSAAVVWGLLRAADGPHHVTVPGSSRRRRAGLHVHNVARLGSDDVTTRRGIPVTTPARTVLDLARAAEGRELGRALDEAETRRLVRRGTLLAMLDREPGRRGGAVLRALLERERGPSLTRSEAEERMLALVRAAGLPEPRVNAHLGRHEVDLLWDRERLVLEVDGYAYHSSHSAFERDRRRDAELLSAGFRVVRVTWRALVEEREAVVAHLAAALAHRTGRDHLTPPRAGTAVKGRDGG